MTKNALVTGGTRGIGAAISKNLKEKGYNVIASYVSNNQNAHDFSQNFGIETICFDVSDEKACQQACQEVQKRLGSIDILVHNAGVTADAMLLKMTAEQWHKVIQTNLSSAFYLTQAVLGGMRNQNYGRLVYISSVNGIKGQRGQANYAASKAGLIGFAKSVALEIAQKGITANVIAPGYVDTEMVRAIAAPILEKITSAIPVGRLGHAEEIAAAVTFLVDETSGFMTGSVLNINGGMY